MTDATAAPDLSTYDDLRLLAAAESLSDTYAKRLAVGMAADDVEAAHATLAKELRSRGLLYEPLSMIKARYAAPPVWQPHLFQKADASADGDGDEGDSHAFHPVRNVCRVCRRPAEDHVSKAATPDEEVYKALQPLDDERRRQMAEHGIALPDGSFPIPDEAHLHAAIRLAGQAQDPQAAMQHIIERARAMGMEHALPPAWQVDTANPSAPPAVGPGAHSMPGPAAKDPNMGKPSAVRPAGGPPAPGMPGSTPPSLSKPGAPGGVPGFSQGPEPDGDEGDDDPWGDDDGDEGGDEGGQPEPKRSLMKRITAAVAKAIGYDTPLNVDPFLDQEIDLEDDFDYAVVKARGEDRYTLGPVYMPNQYDAHGEWVTPEDLQKSVWDYVRETGGDRTVYLQHSPRPAGEWVEVMTWPHEVRATMTKSIDGVQKSEETVFPAGTAYMGVQWQPWAWEKVKRNELTGFSMGGHARRVEAEID